MKKARFLRARYFAWVAVPLALLAFGGSPADIHVIWSYDWQPTGPNSSSDWSQRHYTRCTFIGRHGAITEYPTNGKCGWLRFVPNAEARS